MKNLIQRVISIFIPVTLQVVVLWALLTLASYYQTMIYIIMQVLALLFVLRIVSTKDDGSYKNLWLILILSFPVLGALFYLLWGLNNTSRKLQTCIDRGKTHHKVLEHKQSSKLAITRPRLASTLKYIETLAEFDVVKNSKLTFYKIGEDLFDAMLEEISLARETIYLEYFIVDDGYMWQKMLAILKEKAVQGVDVRFIYDDLGSITTFSNDNCKELTEAGIKYVAFNKLGFVTGALNNRDHRKMLIIDGKVAFSGGINLADEYINRIQKFGHWKDIGFRAEGEVASRYLTLFIDFWNSFSRDPIDINSVIEDYPLKENHNGYSLTYYDNPNNKVHISNTLYIELLNSATKRAYFYSPYVMLGDELQDAMIRAAKRGIDIQIVTPHIGDSALVHRITRSYYQTLIEAGVKIFEYTPGYVHAKATIFDDDICSIGTVNLDFRSLYLHYECNTLFIGANIYSDLLADFESTKQLSQPVEFAQCKKRFVGRIIDGVLRVFAPLC